MLHAAGLTVLAVVSDGASENRAPAKACHNVAFAKALSLRLNLDIDFEEMSVMEHPLLPGVPLAFLSDSGHVLKKARNALFASGFKKGKDGTFLREMQVIVWQWVI